MKRYLLAAAAVTVLASPAYARDGQPYFGIEGGILFPKDQDADVDINYTTTDTTTLPGTVFPGTPPADTTFDDAFGLDYKKGLDVDAIIGYDFGMFRLEGELGWKRAKLDEFSVNSDFVDDLNLALNRPDVDCGTADPCGAFPAISDADFDLDGKVTVLSAMLNGLVDFGNEDGLSFYAGGGIGRARVKALGDKDSAMAWQLIAGVRYAISPNIDFGLKYRFFRTGKLDLADDSVLALAGNTETIGDALYSTYLFPFEVASLILLVAMIGAILLAKRDLFEDVQR
jgi:opacity protein-like surface antigen